jgi:MAC/Perforin domain
MPPIPPVVPSASDRISVLADEYLGVTYNPVSGAFGRACVLELDPSDIRIEKFSDHRSENFVSVKDNNQDNDPTASRLGVVDFQMRDVPGLSSHYSSSLAFKSARSVESQLHLLRCVTAVANVPHNAALSKEMMAQIERLPPLPAAGGSTESRQAMQAMQQYHDFFASHGTHIVLRVAFGGVLRVISQVMEGSTFSYTQDHASTIDHAVGPAVPHETTSRRSTETYQVMIFRDGGGAVASQLTRTLEQQFSDLRNPSSLSSQSDWTGVRTQWIDALQNDPVFCPDDEETKYCWLYDLASLTKKQRADLKRASKSYLAAWPKQEMGVTMDGSAEHVALRNGNPGKYTRTNTEKINRVGNYTKVVKKFKVAWGKITGSKN